MAGNRPIDAETLLSAAVDDRPIEYSSVDAILYALSVGFGGSPRDERELHYVYRQPLLKIVPTFAGMLPGDGFPSAEQGWDAQQARHVEQKLELYRPLPASGSLVASQRVVTAEQASADHPARIVVHSEVRLASDETALFSLSSGLVSSPAAGYRNQRANDLACHRVPGRDPDLSCEISTCPEQALLFSLNGTHHPLHVDPQAAHEAGYDRPLLPGRCLFGIACRAILRTICDYDYTLIKAMEARFPAPVYPGDRLRTDMWQDGNIVSFRCSVPDRSAVVIDGGRCTLAG